MEHFRRRSSAESGIKYLERVLSGRPIPTREGTSSSSTESSSLSPEAALDLKGPLGLTLLHAPSEPLVDFVFIHGLGGGSRKTWSKSNNPYHYWPKEWLPRDPDFKNVRVHTFGYKADWGEKAASVLNVDDFARSLLGDITDNPDIRRSETSIVLIGHSMGGIVIKKAYILSRQDSTFKDIAARIHTIYFLATPHRGSDLAQTLTNILKVSYGQKPFVNDLEKNSGLIHSINDTFRHYHAEVQLWSFYETQKSSVVLTDVMIVDKSSATLGYTNERTALLNADHRGVVKFDLPSDPNYKTLRNAFSSTVDSIVQKVLESKHEASRNDLTRLKSLIGAVDLPEDDLLVVEENKVPGSCEWLTVKPQFEEWKDFWSISPPIFWLTGMPASGKSVLSSHVIDSIEGHNLDCSYFFFRHGTSGKSTLSDLLRSLAYQMALKNAEIRRRLLLVEADGISFDNNDERAIWRKLFINGIFLVKPFTAHFWVIDGLDECNKIQGLFPMLAKIEDGIPLRIFMTSRKSQEIEHGMSGLGRNVMHQEIQSTDTVEDIKAYITSKMDHLPVDDAESCESLTERILTKAAGSFLWVRLVVRELENSFSEEAVAEVLDSIPADMNQLYARTLDNMSNSGRSSKLARTILTWTVTAARPLTLEEMQSIIKLELNETVPNLVKFVSSICGQLVFVDQQSRIQMVHQTARDYLLKDINSEFAVKRGDANMQIAIKCLELLAGDAFKASRPRAKKFGGKATSAKDTVLVNYACAYFSDHLYKSSSADSETMDALFDFLNSSVLNWIEHLAKSKETSHIPRAAANIKAYLERRAKYYPPIGTQVQTVEAWITDLIRVSAKFQANILACPESIYWLIPPLCPVESVIHKTHSSPHRGLTIKGMTSTTWDDCLLQIDYRTSQATALGHGEQFFAIGLSTGQVIVYHAESGRPRCTFNHEERVRLVEFGSTDKVIATSGFKNVRVWDVQTGQQLHVFQTPRQTIALAFSRKNEYLMAATQANLVSCWSLEDESPEQEQLSWHGVGEDLSRYMQRQPPTHAAFSADNYLLAIAYRGRPILLFNLELESFFGNLIRHGGGTSHEAAVAIIFNPNPDIKLFVASYHGGELVVYNPWTTELLHILAGINAHTLACSPDGRTLVTGSSFGTIQVFDFGGVDGAMLILLYRINAFEEGIKQLAFSSDNLRFLDIRGSQCRIWEPPVLVRKDLEDGTQSELSDPVPLSAKTVGMLEGEREPELTILTCHASGDFVFCGKEDGTVSIYSTKDGKQMCILYRHTHDIRVTSITFGHQSSIIVSADESGRVMIYQLALAAGTWFVIKLLADERFDNSVQGLLLSPDDNSVLVCGRDVIELRTATGERTATIITTSQAPQQAIQHPHLLDAFIVSNHATARIYRWADLTELTSESGIILESNQVAESTHNLRTSIHGKEIFVQLSEIEHNASILTCWQSSDFRSDQTHVKQMPGFAYLGSKVEHLIGVTGSRLLFLDTDLWVCSLDLKSFSTTAQAKRHFFLPSDWQVASGDMLFQYTAKNDFVFAKKHELVVISRGLDFSDLITLSRLQQMNLNLPVRKNSTLKVPDT